MQKYVFLAISVFVLGYCQGKKGCVPLKCICPKILDKQQFAFIARVTHVNYIPRVVPTGYNSIVVVVEQLCNGTSPIEKTARLNTFECPDSHAFTHLQVNQYYFFHGTYQHLHPDYRRSFVVDKCGPPCRPAHLDTCPKSLDECHNYYYY